MFGRRHEDDDQNHTGAGLCHVAAGRRPCLGAGAGGAGSTSRLPARPARQRQAGRGTVPPGAARAAAPFRGASNWPHARAARGAARRAHGA
ncbi:hypothetical protein HZZ02_23265, partial [Streptococcus danieliae]|nr:hypothetical protein [Streptococcus danieliae]